MNIDKSIENLKKYVEEDDIYTRYKNGEYKEISDFELFCINHCKDIEIILGNLEMKKTANKELENKNNEILNSNIGIDLSYDDYIPKQAIKDKIEEINKKYEDSKDENGESPYYYPEYTIRVLKKLLQESEDK